MSLGGMKSFLSMFLEEKHFHLLHFIALPCSLFTNTIYVHENWLVHCFTQLPFLCQYIRKVLWSLGAFFWAPWFEILRAPLVTVPHQQPKSTVEKIWNFLFQETFPTLFIARTHTDQYNWLLMIWHYANVHRKEINLCKGLRFSAGGLLPTRAMEIKHGGQTQENNNDVLHHWGSECSAFCVNQFAWERTLSLQPWLHVFTSSKLGLN